MLFISAEGEEFEVEPGDEQAARKEGLKRAFTFKDQQGEEVVVAETDLDAAQEAGLTPLRVDGEEISGLEAFGRGLGSSLSFGFSDEIGGAIGAAKEKLTGSDESFRDLYQRERDLQRLQNEAAYEGQTGAYGLGFAGGLLGSPASLIGRGAAKLATKGTQALAKPTVAQVAGRGAVEGAVAGAGGGAGLAGGADIVGGEEGEIGKLAAQTALGATGGAALGGALGGLAKGASRVGQDIAGEARENVMLKSLGYHTAKPRTMLKKAGIEPEDLAQNLEQRGVFQGVRKTKDVVENVNKLAREDAAKIGETIKDIDAVTKKSAPPEAFLESIIRYRQGVQKELLGSKTAAMDRADAEQLVKKFTSGVDKKFLGGYTPKELGQLSVERPAQYAKIVKKLEKQGFDDLYSEKSAISRAIRDLRGQSKAAKAEKAKDIQRVLMDTVEGHVKRNAPDEETAQQLINRLAQDRKDMLFSRTAANIAKESAEREAKNRALSLTDIITGGSVATGLGSALGPAGIPLGFAIGTGAAKLGRTKGLGALYRPLKAAEETLDAGAFEKAAQGLTKAGTITGAAGAFEASKKKKKDEEESTPSSL